MNIRTVDTDYKITTDSGGTSKTVNVPGLKFEIINESTTNRTTTTDDESKIIRLENAGFTALTLSEFSAAGQEIAVQFAADIPSDTVTLTSANGMSVEFKDIIWNNAFQGSFIVFRCVDATTGAQKITLIGG